MNKPVIMDMNNTKPPGGNDPPVGPDEQPVNGKRDASLAAKGKVELSPEEASPTLSFVAQFNRAALDDPEKMDVMVRASVSELVDARLDVTGPLSGPDKQSLVDFLSGDPLFRRQMESYLRKVLA